MWSPDGSQLAIAGGSGTVWLWNLAPDDGRDLDAFAHCVSPWMPVAAGAKPRPFEPTSCRALTR